MIVVLEVLCIAAAYDTEHNTGTISCKKIGTFHWKLFFANHEHVQYSATMQFKFSWMTNYKL